MAVDPESNWMYKLHLKCKLIHLIVPTYQLTGLSQKVLKKFIIGKNPTEKFSLDSGLLRRMVG